MGAKAEFEGGVLSVPSMSIRAGVVRRSGGGQKNRFERSGKPEYGQMGT
jgi:hypothetical protein